MMDGKLVPNEYLVDTMRDIVKEKCERRNGLFLMVILETWNKLKF